MNTAQALTLATEGYHDAERPIEQARFAKLMQLLQPHPELVAFGGETWANLVAGKPGKPTATELHVMSKYPDDERAIR